MKQYTVEAHGDILLWISSLETLALILNLHQDAVDRIRYRCETNRDVCVLHASRLNPLIPRYPELTVYCIPPWQRLLSDNQRMELCGQQAEDVSSDYADYPLDLMSTNEVLKWEEDNARED